MNQWEGIMAKKSSTVETALKVLQDAASPLTFDELFSAVNSVEPIRTRDPRQTLRGAIANTKLIQSTGDGRFGYLPALITGATVRHVLSASDLQGRLLIMGWEVISAIWPAGFEIQMRQDREPRTFILPDAEVFSAPLTFFGPYLWGLSAEPPLWHWLQKMNAQAGDSLFVHALDGVNGRYRLTFEPRAARAEARLAARNKALGDVVYELCKASRGDAMIHDLALRALAHGAYHDPYPPEPLAVVLLQRDGRFRDYGMGIVKLAEKWEPGDDELVRIRNEGIGELLRGLFPSPRQR
jgi:hypothetical protein